MRFASYGKFGIGATYARGLPGSGKPRSVRKFQPYCSCNSTTGTKPPDLIEIGAHGTGTSEKLFQEMPSSTSRPFQVSVYSLVSHGVKCGKIWLTLARQCCSLHSAVGGFEPPSNQAASLTLTDMGTLRVSGGRKANGSHLVRSGLTRLGYQDLTIQFRSGRSPTHCARISPTSLRRLDAPNSMLSATSLHQQISFATSKRLKLRHTTSS